MSPDRKAAQFGQIEKIQLKVGREPSERLQWVLNFAQKDLGELTTGEWEDLRWEMAAFSYTLIWWDRLPKYQQKLLRESFGGHTFNAKVTIDIPSPKEITAIHKGFNHILSELRKDGHAEIGPIEMVMGAFWNKGGSKGRNTDAAARRKSITDLFNMYLPPFYDDPFRKRKDPPTVFTGGFFDQARVRLIELIQGHPGMLHVCKDKSCARWFVAARVNREYCSKKCQTRARSQRFRLKKAKGKK